MKTKSDMQSQETDFKKQLEAAILAKLEQAKKDHQRELKEKESELKAALDEKEKVK